MTYREAVHCPECGSGQSIYGCAVCGHGREPREDDTMGWKEREASDAVGIGPKENQKKKVLGLLSDIRHDVGENKSSVYELVQQDGEVLKVWGSSVIDSKLGEQDRGRFVKLTYLGEEKSRAGRTFKNVRVDVFDGGVDEFNDAMREWPRVEEFYPALKRNGAAVDTGPGIPDDDEDDDSDLPF